MTDLDHVVGIAFDGGFLQHQLSLLRQDGRRLVIQDRHQIEIVDAHSVGDKYIVCTSQSSGRCQGSSENSSMSYEHRAVSKTMLSI